MSYAGAQPGLPGAVDRARCGAVRFDIRCQLQVDHDIDQPHVAMTRHVSSRTSGFAIWTGDGRSSWQYQIGALPWAQTFPRVA